MEITSARLQQFENILKEYDQTLELYFSPNKQTKLADIHPKDLFSVTIKWSNLSKQGLVCGILGCSEEPNKKCNICTCSYCSEHISWHFHSATNTGILEKDSTEMR